VTFHFPSKSHHCGEFVHSKTNPDVSKTSQLEGSGDIKNIFGLEPERNSLHFVPAGH
jgi:hypothetical protein